MSKPVIGFRVSNFRSGSGYDKLNIEIMALERRDAMADVRQNLGCSYVDQYLKEAKIIRELSGDTKYLRREFCQSVEINVTWQASDDKPREYYAPGVELRYGSEQTIALLSRLVKAAGYLGWETDPRAWLQALMDKAGAVPVYYVSEVGSSTFLPCQDWRLDEAIPPALAQESTAA